MLKKIIVSLIILSTSLSCGIKVSAEDFNQIEKLFSLRTAITDQGIMLPEKIKSVQGNDVRTLERIFEMETSVLTTIEAYFRILMIAVSTKSETNPETIKILNGWLEFIESQCGFDINYLNEALKETSNPDVIEQINIAKRNSENLAEIVEKSVKENNNLIGKTIE
ncbi:MAG: hypothetical protein KAI70_01940 [Candidatus Omnitrophica bacterium]|nr:hypothetical protein [Candidatus Omnitrophota bacterium]